VIVEGDGFKDIATKLIFIGATYGKITNLSKVLPCATTVSHHLSTEVNKAKLELIDKLASVRQFGVTTDLWTHQHTNESHITITAQYIDITDRWRVQTQVLAIQVFNERHTADNIRSVMNSVLHELGAVKPSNVFVTDNASNTKVAFRNHTWLGCVCHNLNPVLSHGLQEAKESKLCTLPHKVTELSDSCKEVVTLAKLNCQLETSLKQTE